MSKNEIIAKLKSKYYNRDLSWLRFNHRVLQEMMDKRNPLFERLKFAAIFSSNLDEFFEVRVSTIRRIKTLDKPLRKKLITKPNRLLKTIKKNISELDNQYHDSLFNDLLPALRKVGFNILLPDNFDSEVLAFCEKYFKDHIETELKSQYKFKKEKDRLFIKSGQVYLVGQGDNHLLVYELPKNHDRFIKIDKDTETYVFLDDIIRVCLKKKHGSSFYSLKASRDAELYIEDEYSGNLKEKIQKSLSNRETGQFSTAMIDKEMPQKYLDQIYQILDITDTDIIFSGKYQKLKDLFSLDLPAIDDQHMISLPPIRSAALDCFDCMLHAVKEKDRLLYYPYESFEEVVRFVSEAAKHPSVKIIKMTLYRVSKTSAIANGLLQALENGKKVCVFIETKARFDESNNIFWGEKLAKAGANVIYSYPGIKVHSKVMYIKAEEAHGIQEYAYIGTGNFNEKTSKVYTDYGLLTADSSITSEIAQVFSLLERRIIVPKLKQLMVSPFNTRSRLIDLINREIDNAKEEKEAYLIFKMNSLEDKKMIKALYKASKAGVKITLLIRGICCLLPGLKDLSENIEIISIVDRFLEHGRVYLFANNGEEQMFIGSADLMRRNLDSRIEVLTPIKDKDAFDKIRTTVDMQISDKVKARIIDGKQLNNFAETGKDYRRSSQHNIYNYLLELNTAEQRSATDQLV